MRHVTPIPRLSARTAEVTYDDKPFNGFSQKPTVSPDPNLGVVDVETTSIPVTTDFNARVDQILAHLLSQEQQMRVQEQQILARLHIQEQQIHKIQGDVHTVRENVIRTSPQRRNFTKETIAQHLRTIASEPFNGKCPCCHETPIIQNGMCLEGSFEKDHYRNRHDRKPRNTWIICVDCHSHFTSYDWNRDDPRWERRFVFYQQRRQELIDAGNLPGL